MLPIFLYWRRQALDHLERFPETYRLGLVLRHRNSPFVRRIVSNRHDIVIEGYPRSANSFAHRAFMFSNGWRDPRVAGHTHSPVQVVLGARWKRPVLLLIREPAAAVVSLMALQFSHLAGDRRTLDEQRAWVRYQTNRYAQFYGTTNPFAESLVLSTFAQTTGDFGAVIERVNRRFGTDFIPFEHTAENIAVIFRRGGTYLSPDRKRDDLKQRFIELYQEAGNTRQRSRAERAYEAALNLAARQP